MRLIHGETEVNRGPDSESRWTWVPTVRYGPFVFGVPTYAVPLMGSILEESHLGPVEGDDMYRRYNSTMDGIEIWSWDGFFVGVDLDREFFVAGVDVIGLPFEVVDELLGADPTVDDDDSETRMISYDSLGLRLWVDSGWIVRSASVGGDADDIVEVGRLQWGVQ